MSQDGVMGVFIGAVGLAFKLCAPMLITAMVVGLVIAILQAATQVHEQTLTFAPKAIAVAFGLLALGPWMINEIVDYVTEIFDLMSRTEL
ncbi:MAG: flagellar biosynthesis protein FliQ [Oscillospiraceae bacterium]|jgi:flagellar biosynthetic protein FliQ|nr:flagellar biosynthesis protein FliQ [Oscillospiraceae bacterium]